MTLALFRVAAEPKTIHSKVNIGPGCLHFYLGCLYKLTDLFKKIFRSARNAL